MYESLQQTDADAAKHHADLPCWPLVVYGAVEDVRHSNVVGYSDNPARVQNGALEQFDFGGNAPETNSLCCAAAGIIDPLSATAETLIPHEKLRGAAVPDATLIAQNRPPAQLVVGYKYSPETSHQPQTRQLSGRIVNSLGIHRERCRAPQSINRACIGKKARHDHALLQGAPNNQKGFHHIGQRQIDRINATHCEQLLLNCGHYFNSGSLVIGLNCVEVLKQKTTHRSGTRCNTAIQSKHHFIVSPACLSRVTRLFISYNQCSYNRSQATDYLEPSRRITLPKKPEPALLQRAIHPAGKATTKPVFYW